MYCNRATTCSTTVTHLLYFSLKTVVDVVLNYWEQKREKNSTLKDWTWAQIYFWDNIYLFIRDNAGKHSGHKILWCSAQKVYCIQLIHNSGPWLDFSRKKIHSQYKQQYITTINNGINKQYKNPIPIYLIQYNHTHWHTPKTVQPNQLYRFSKWICICFIFSQFQAIT